MQASDSMQARAHKALVKACRPCHSGLNPKRRVRVQIVSFCLLQCPSHVSFPGLGLSNPPLEYSCSPQLWRFSLFNLSCTPQSNWSSEIQIWAQNEINHRSIILPMVVHQMNAEACTQNHHPFLLPAYPARLPNCSEVCFWLFHLSNTIKLLSVCITLIPLQSSNSCPRKALFIPYF